MTVQEIWTPDEKSIPDLIRAMSLNHDVTQSEDNKTTGDPTEIAMVKFAQEHESFNSSWKVDHGREEELPFDSDRKAMTTIHKYEKEYLVVTKGASESISSKISSGDNEIWQQEEERMAKKGMRIIAFAEKKINEIPSDLHPDSIENDLKFIGLAGLIDPPREEAKKAIGECKSAGIIPVMITGDHPLTAAAIARELGILDETNDRVMTGKELASIDEEDYIRDVEGIHVYARVSPEQKLNIVKALQEKEHYVAMTGDGVNDAPSLRRANIGVAMGITGTDVTREAAHMILLDDNFATIVKAVRQGRRIYDNIRKFVKYILTGNTAEIWTIFLAPLVGLPIPLLPVHILWVNLVTDGLPALALASEPAEKSIMKRRPRKSGESIFAGGIGVHVLWVGILIGFICIGTQGYLINKGVDHWQTIVFSILCFCQLWHVMAIRSDTRSLFRIGVFSNKVLLGAVVLTVILQLAIIYLPFMNQFFHTQPLTMKELLLVIVASSITFWAVEVEKLFKRRKSQGGKLTR
jgi:Ca2+-transporting ATPase